MNPGDQPPAAVEVELAYARPEHVIPDPKGSGLLRARAIPFERMRDPDAYARHRCRVLDCSATPEFSPRLTEQGFAHVDLAPVPELADLLEWARRDGSVTPALARSIRRRLLGRSLTLGSGERLRIVFIASEGFIMRCAGPNGLPLGPTLSSPGMNGHDAATVVHADQDVDGTPVRQILRDAAPFLFRHRSPGHENRRSPLVLINVWIGLDQVTRPLALMDGTTLDRRAHQLRYGLPTDAFLARDEDRSVNDIWAFLHHERQQWYFTSDLAPASGYVFDTLSTPHGAMVLPGEDRAEQLWKRLGDALECVAAGDAAGLARAVSDPDPISLAPQTPPRLRRAIAELESALQQARTEGSELLGRATGPWHTRAAQARDRVVRKSLEMRAVAWIGR